MAVNCQVCGVSMTTAERTANRRGQAGNWHYDCEYLDDMRAKVLVADPFLAAEIQKSQTKLTAKKGGQATNFP